MSISPSTLQHITGLGSGIDYESMITQLMNAERAPQDKLRQNLTKVQWTEDAYRSINLALSTFQGKIQNLQYSAGWNLQNVTSSNTAVITASANNGATTGSHTISVSTLATGAALTGNSAITSSPSLVGTKDVSGGVTITSGQNDQLTVTLNGVSKIVTLAAGSYTLGGTGSSSLTGALQTAIDNAFNANQISVSSSGNYLTLTPVTGGSYTPQLSVSASGANTGLTSLLAGSGETSFAYKVDPAASLNSQASKMGYNPGTDFLTGSTYSFTINNQTITYTGSDSINSILQKVNNSAAGVTMSYDSVTDKVSFNSKNTGATAVVNFGNEVTGASGSFLEAMHIEDTSGNVIATGSAQGTNAQLTIDGVNTQQASNSFTSNGINFTLLNTTTSSGSVTVNVSPDTNAIVKQITDFVDNYNTLIGQVATKLNEPIFRDFQPLTSSQQSQMTDSQIQAWNQKAQSGVLQNDDILQNVYDNFRQATYQSVAGTSTYTALYEIGITSYSYTQFQNDPGSAGKLNVDTAKLQQALTTNPNDVSTIMESLTKQLNTQAQNAVTSIFTRAGYTGTGYDSVTTTLGLQASNLESQISNWDKRLASIEQQYYTQFTAMDTAVGNNNQQLAWLQSALK